MSSQAALCALFRGPTTWNPYMSVVPRTKLVFVAEGFGFVYSR